MSQQKSDSYYDNNNSFPKRLVYLFSIGKIKQNPAGNGQELIKISPSDYRTAHIAAL